MPARLQPGETIVPSVIDRLLDDDPGETAERPRSAAQKLREFRASVLRDVTNLLNTRRRWPGVSDRPELVPSSFDYGIRDVTAADLSTEAAREDFRLEVEDVLRRYEPRFRSVRVTLLLDPDGVHRAVRFRVDAVLHTEPVPEPLAFESVIDPADGSVEVTQ
jgi:type VI secretion system protein ImpF